MRSPRAGARSAAPRGCRPSALPVPVVGVATAALLGQLEQVDASAVHPDDRGQPAQRVVHRALGVECCQLDGLTGLGNVAELLHHQPADGLVFTFGSTETSVLGYLVG